MLHLIKQEICFEYIIIALVHMVSMLTSLNTVLFLRALSSSDLSFVSSVTYILIFCTSVRIHFGLIQKCNVLEKGLI